MRNKVSVVLEIRPWSEVQYYFLITFNKEFDTATMETIVFRFIKTSES